MSTALKFPLGRLARRLLACCASVAVVACTLRADPLEDSVVGVAVKIYARGSGSSTYVSLNGTFLSSTPGANDGYASATGYSGPAPEYKAFAMLGAPGFVRVEPGKSYTISASGTVANGEINIVAPAGYRVVMDGMVRSRETFDTSATMVFQILPTGIRHPGVAGMASSVAASEIEWRLSLGSLRNGGSAGELSLIDSGTGASWTPVFTPSALYYEPVSDEITVNRSSNVIQKVITNQMAVDIVTLSTTAYEIRCYYPSQYSGGTFTGQPFAVYRVEQWVSPTSLKFTKEIYDVSATNSTPPLARREIMTLARTGVWPAYTWTRTDWTVEGAVPLTETVVTSSGTTASRTEAIVVHDGPGAAATLNLSRSYQVVGNVGEVVSGETVGTSTGLTSTFTYYSDASQFGSFGNVKSAVLPGGRWVAFDYYDENIAAGDRGGRIKYSYKPFVSSPSTVTRDPTQGEVSYFEYTRDIFGAPNRTALEETRVNNTLVARAVTAYNDTIATANGYAITASTRIEQSSPTETLRTVTRSYRADVGNSFIRGQPYSITKPDGVKQAFVYQLGSGSSSGFTPDTGSAIGEGTGSRIGIITGSANPAAGTRCPDQDGVYTVDEVYLVDGKSTKEVTIRDSRALVVRTESHVWKNGSWQRVAYTTFGYDYAGRLTNRVTSTGATYTALYQGGLKTTETDESGITTDYQYDVGGRVQYATRQGSGPIAKLITRFTYDAASHLTEEKAGFGQTETLTISHQYDDAGRLHIETPPGGYGAATHTYDAANRKHTITQADSTTVVTEDYLDGRPYSRTGTGIVPEYHTYDVETSGTPIGQRWHKVNVGTSASARWKKTWSDWLGREVKSQRPGFTGQADMVDENTYEPGTGHLIVKTSSGLTAPTRYEYNFFGQVVRTGADINNDGKLALASTDRISDTDTYIEQVAGEWWLRRDTKTYPTNNSARAILSSVSRKRLTGHPAGRVDEVQSVDIEGNVTRKTTDVNRTTKVTTVTTTNSGLAYPMTETSVNGFPRTTTGFDGLSSTKGYDSLLRPSAITNSRGNTTSNLYVTGTKLVERVTDAAGYYAQTAYDAMGRVNIKIDPKGYYTRLSYTARGQLYRQWGDGAMPVEYGYDSTYGDKTTMKTFRGGSSWDGTSWPASPGTADTTTWGYDGPSGLLTTKTDAASHYVGYTYNERGQVHVRTWARGTTTTYGYDGATGELLTQTYSDSTPTITYTYGRSGQTESVDDFTGTRDFVYDPTRPWRLSAEAESSFYGSKVITRLYDESAIVGRVRGFQVGAAAGDSGDLEQTFGFMPNGRFETITSKRDGNSASRTFRYGYLPDAALLKSVAIDQGAGPGGHPFTISRDYEPHRDLIVSLESKWSTTSRTKYVYEYDERGQRKNVVQSGDVFADFGDSTFRLFSYDGRGEVTGDIAYLGSNVATTTAPLPGRRHEFDYDNAQNRKWSNRTGVSGLRDDYSTNALNQYTDRENNTLPVSGTAETDTGGAGGTAVSVKAGSATPIAASRQGRYWSDELAIPNTLGPWRGNVTIFTAKRGSGGGADLLKQESRMAEMAAGSQSFTYDNDGNLTSDGIVDYTWDAENRLTKMETTSAAQAVGFPHKILEFRYDYMHRRVQKRVLDADSSPSREISSTRFLYDGWNLLVEYAAPGGTSLGVPIRSYTWGLDIAISMTNAGGVGGLLEIADHTSGKTYLPGYDGNGNVVALLNADYGSQAAKYEYGPFGEIVRAENGDTTIADNPIRYSTKFSDLETGLVYYGRRYYSPHEGRFVGRDVIGEKGGVNLFAFCQNNSINHWDYLGMADEIVTMAPYVVTARRDGDDQLNAVYDGPGPSGGQTDGGGGSFQPFKTGTPLPLGVGWGIRAPDGTMLIVVSAAGTDEHGVTTWNAMPMTEYLQQQAQQQAAQAAAAAAQAMQDLQVSTTQAATNFVVGVAAGVAGAALVVVTGPVGAALLLGVAAGATVPTYSDMSNNPGNYTPGQVVNFTAANVGGVVGGAGASEIPGFRAPVVDLNLDLPTQPAGPQPQYPLPVVYTNQPPAGITPDTIVIVDGVPMRWADAPMGTAFMPGGGVGRVQGGAIGDVLLPSGSLVVGTDGATSTIPKGPNTGGPTP